MLKQVQHDLDILTLRLTYLFNYSFIVYLVPFVLSQYLQVACFPGKLLQTFFVQTSIKPFGICIKAELTWLTFDWHGLNTREVHKIFLKHFQCRSKAAGRVLQPET